MLQRLEKKEQTILFLNRRGYSTSLQCPLCGFVAECLTEGIVTQADTEPASVEQQRKLGQTAPSLYDMRNLFQVNVEEGRHLWAMVYLLHSYFGRDGREEAEDLLQRLPPGLTGLEGIGVQIACETGDHATAVATLRALVELAPADAASPDTKEQLAAHRSVSVPALTKESQPPNSSVITLPDQPWAAMPEAIAPNRCEKLG